MISISKIRRFIAYKKKAAKIYTITGATKLEVDNKGWPNFGSTRVFGYYTDKDVAIESVKTNALDIRETIYDYMIVEEIVEGLYQPSTTRWFFVAKDDDTFEEIKEPTFLRHFAGISMG